MDILDDLRTTDRSSNPEFFQRAADEIAKLREELAEQRLNAFKAAQAANELIAELTQRAERAEARIAETKKHGPLAHIHRTGSNMIEATFFGSLLPADGNYIANELVELLPLNKSVALYAEPIPPADVAELQEEIMRLQAEVANRNRRAVDGDEAVAALNAVHGHYEKRIAELERKAAEQQAIARKYYGSVGAAFIADWNANGSEELNALLAKAREEGRKEAVPEIENICGVDLRGDFAVQLVFASCRSASAFADAMLAAVPKPETATTRET